MALVVDTDVVSYLFKRDTRAALYQPFLNSPPFVISFMTPAELHRWMRERNWGQTRRVELEAYLTRYVVLHSDIDLCERWAQATDSARRNGRPVADAWIAATALHLAVPLVTHNASHYASVDGLDVLTAGSA